MKTHIPKRHCNFEEPIKGATEFDNTYDRINGNRQDQPMVPESMSVGTGKNPADALPRFGKKTMAAEQEVSKPNSDSPITTIRSWLKLQKK